MRRLRALFCEGRAKRWRVDRTQRTGRGEIGHWAGGDGVSGELAKKSSLDRGAANAAGTGNNGLLFNRQERGRRPYPAPIGM